MTGGWRSVCVQHFFLIFYGSSASKSSNSKSRDWRICRSLSDCRTHTHTHTEALTVDVDTPAVTRHNNTKPQDAWLSWRTTRPHGVSQLLLPPSLTLQGPTTRHTRIIRPSSPTTRRTRLHTHAPALRRPGNLVSRCGQPDRKLQCRQRGPISTTEGR